MAAPVSPYRVKEKSGWAIADPHCVRRRVMVCVVVLCCVFSALLARLWYLQVVRGASYLMQAKVNSLKNVPLSAPRGLVFDRHGSLVNGKLPRSATVLATSRASHSVALLPAALPSLRRDPEGRRKILQTLGFLIHTTPAEIEAQLEDAARRGGRLYDPVRVGGEVDLETITRVEENKWRLRSPGLGSAVLVTDDISRHYPAGAMAAHVLGYTGIVNERDIEKAKRNRDEPGTRSLAYDDIIGKSGIERQFDRLLAGVRGSEQYEVDARGRPLRPVGEIREKPGHTLVLSIDAKLQRAAESALDAARNSGAAAAIDPRNGEVLALASRPTFDSNIFSLKKKDFQKRWLAINTNAKKPLINRAVTSAFPPGSTFKMMTAAAGLQQGTTRTGTTHVCNGAYYLGRARFGCWKTHGAGIDIYDAMAQSCDVYFYQRALKMGDPEGTGPTYLAKIARQFGLGEPVGIDLPVDDRRTQGLMPDPAWRRRFHARRPQLAHWYPGNTLNMSIGQGDVTATPLQMALATGAVANGGTLWQPRLMREIRNATTDKVIRRGTSRSRSVGIQDRYLSIVRAGMRQVITKGTARAPFADMTHVAVAGKTGSAEDDANGTAHAWFVCFAPYDPAGRVKPRIAIAVIIENAGHGSENAAPVAKKILEAAFPAPKSSAAKTVRR